MTRIRADFTQTAIPDNVQIGDRLNITGTAHVTGIVEERIETTTFGELTVTLIVEATLERPA